MADPDARLDADMEDRRLELNLGWREIAARSGLSYETLRALRRTGKASALSKRRAEMALEWKAGSIDAILHGGRATPAESGAQATGSNSTTAQDLRIMIAEAQDELRYLSPKYESNRASLTAHLERRIAELQRQLDALNGGN